MRKIAPGLVALGLVGSLAAHGGGAPVAAASCDRKSVAALVRGFVRAYNTDDSARLDRLWAAEPDFEWYSVSPDEREQGAAHDRETLLVYFARRHQLDDRLRLTSLRVGPPNDLGHFGIGYHLRRESDETAGRGRYHGKASAKEVTTLPALGAVSTSRCALFVWSMGRPER